MSTILTPVDILHDFRTTYEQNLATITKNSGRLMLFAADQKMEHLNKDFSGSGIHPDAQAPEHLFAVAQEGGCGAFATHFGVISRYAKQYLSIPYIVKVNGKTDLLASYDDPHSFSLCSLDDIIRLRDAGVRVVGIGYTIYLGSLYEQEMLVQASRWVNDAHAQGMVAILWIYARGVAIVDEQDPSILAGAAGVATSLGADFVKIKAPHDPESLGVIAKAAGNTGVLCSGGQRIDSTLFLERLSKQLRAGASGCAVGRNIFQKSTAEAIALSQKIAQMVYGT